MTKPWLGKVGALFIQKRGCIVSTHPLSSMIFLFVLQEVLQFGVGLYALQLVSDNLPDLGTDTVVVILDHLLHAVVAAGICKARDDGYRPVSLFLTLHFLGIDHNWMINGLI